MLTKGSLALYYGGENILPSLSHLPASPVSPAFMGCSVLFQLSFFIFKKLKFKKLSEISNYHNQLSNTILTGFSNVFNLPSMVIFSAMGFAFLLIHYKIIDNEDEEEIEVQKEDFETVPFSIKLFASILCLLNLGLYQRNIALRSFLKKKVKTLFQPNIRKENLRYKKLRNKKVHTGCKTSDEENVADVTIEIPNTSARRIFTIWEESESIRENTQSREE